MGGGTPGPNEVQMALPAGQKKSKNGKRVYSQSARAVKYRQEMGVGEFAPDAAAETLPPPAQETPPEVFISPGGFSEETIGVTTTATILTPEEPLAPHAEDQPNYVCENCRGRYGIRTMVSLSDGECPVCEETLDWNGLT